MLRKKGYHEETRCYYIDGNPALLHYTYYDSSETGENDLSVQDFNSKPYNICAAPTMQEVVNWLREKHYIELWVEPKLEMGDARNIFFNHEYVCKGINLYKDPGKFIILEDRCHLAEGPQWNSYAQALAVGIIKALELLPDKK